MTTQIDDLLARAKLAPVPYSQAEIDAAEIRLRERLALSAATVKDTVVPREPDERGAARGLRALCEAVVTATALRGLQHFLSNALPDPAGARVLACALQLTGCEEAARFWWQYAAGAGDTTALYCLYLHHLALGEGAEAEWWYGQMTDEDGGPDGGECPGAGDGCAQDAGHGDGNGGGCGGEESPCGRDGGEARGNRKPLRPLTGVLLQTGADTSLTTTLRVLAALKAGAGYRSLPASVRAVLDYIPAAIAYVDVDLDLPLPAPDFTHQVQTLTRSGPGPARPPRPGGRKLPERRAGNAGQIAAATRTPTGSRLLSFAQGQFDTVPA